MPGYVYVSLIDSALSSTFKPVAGQRYNINMLHSSIIMLEEENNYATFLAHKNAELCQNIAINSIGDKNVVCL